jgi:hypothetical protein
MSIFSTLGRVYFTTLDRAPLSKGITLRGITRPNRFDSWHMQERVRAAVAPSTSLSVEGREIAAPRSAYAVMR